MRILFKLTSRERPQKFLTTLKSLVDNLSPNSNHLLIITLDDDDPRKDEYISGFKAMDAENELPEAIIRIGDHDNKVFAINRDMPDNMDWDILVNVSDDQIFTKAGFDQDIIAGFEMNPHAMENGGTIMDGDGFFGQFDNSGVTQYDLDLFLHFPDGYVNERLASMSIMGRVYWQRFDYIYHPDYISLWCDNEAMEVAQEAGKYRYIDKAIFKHEHPANVPGVKVDDLLRYTQSFYLQDQKTYLKRKALNFPKESAL